MIGHRALWRTAALSLAVILALGACDQGAVLDLEMARRLYTGTDTMGTIVRERTIAVHGRHDLTENSGVVMSASQPGIIFTINDSGNEPLLFALDTTGANRGVWHVQGAANVDWEAIAGGPCGGRAPGDSANPQESCLYIADVGDNEAMRTSLTLYRVREPLADSAGRMSSIRTESLSFSYDDRPHDVEAIYVAADGAVHLITKRPLRTLLRRRRPSLVFTIPATAWSGRTTIAHRVDSLGIVPGSAPNRVITDASLSRDGRLLAVRTYWQIYIFATDSATGRVAGFQPRAVCNVAGLHERQGEGISWYPDGKHLLLSSEGRDQPLRIVECPIER
jgi:hypothetical protein